MEGTDEKFPNQVLAKIKDCLATFGQENVLGALLLDYSDWWGVRKDELC
jgi:hypothetical protein